MTENLTMRARAEAPRSTVYRALTNPKQLELWLAEDVVVDLPDRYEFWGRFIPEGEAPHQSAVAVGDNQLAFTWRLSGKDTRVTIVLEADGPDQTVISVGQTDFTPMGPGALGQLQTFWALAIANLVDLVEERELTARVDLTSDDLSARTVIDASPEEVFESLIDTEQVSRWFGFPTPIEPRVGGRYGFGKIVELDPDRSLTVEYGGMGVARWELEGSEGRTSLVITQAGFGDGQPPYAAWLGILSGLAELRRFHELPDWEPIWITEAA